MRLQAVNCTANLLAIHVLCRIAKQPFWNDFSLFYYLRQWYISDFAFYFHVVSLPIVSSEWMFIRDGGRLQHCGSSLSLLLSKVRRGIWVLSGWDMPLIQAIKGALFFILFSLALHPHSRIKNKTSIIRNLLINAIRILDTQHWIRSMYEFRPMVSNFCSYT